MKALLPLAVLGTACNGQKSETKKAPRVDPDRVTVDHILIGVRGKMPTVTRTKEEAKELADQIVARLKAGEDWAALKNEYSDDPAPKPGEPKGGPYAMDVNQPRRDMAKITAGQYAKDDMAPGFADTSFSLDVGEIAIAPYDKSNNRSPFGFHIIKRIK